MEPLQTIKTLIARLAGAPLAPSRAAFDPPHPTPPGRRRGDPSGLYAERAVTAPPARTSKQRDGDEGEAFARRYLERAGLAFVAANVRYRDGELDLVMRDARCGGGGVDAGPRAGAAAGVGAGPGPAAGAGAGASASAEERAGVGTLVFVEVRRRRGASHGGAAASVTREKRRRLVAAAAHYLVGLNLRVLPACRFDVLTLDGDPVRGFRVELIRDAFRDEG